MIPSEIFLRILDFKNEFEMIDIRNKHPLNKVLKIDNFKSVYFYQDKDFTKPLLEMNSNSMFEAILSIISIYIEKKIIKRRTFISEELLTIKTTINKNFELHVCTRCWIYNKIINPLFIININKQGEINKYIITECNCFN